MESLEVQIKLKHKQGSAKKLTLKKKKKNPKQNLPHTYNL